MKKSKNKGNKNKKKYYTGYLKMVEKAYGRRTAERFEKLHPNNVKYQD